MPAGLCTPEQTAAILLRSKGDEAIFDLLMKHDANIINFIANFHSRQNYLI